MQPRPIAETSRPSPSVRFCIPLLPKQSGRHLNPMPLRSYARHVPATLAVSGLSKRYGSVEALRGVELEVEDGELVGLLGPNGAGKSTLVKIAAGLVRPTGGTAVVAGAPAGSRTARASLGY